MKIHTMKANETVDSVAKSYGISTENIYSTNLKGIENATVGEELLILTPTRTYTLSEGDTLERLALRFGVRIIDILAQNPYFSEKSSHRGTTLNLKYDDKIYGSASTNGYLYPGFDKAKLSTALPYLTYVTVCCAIAEEEKIKFCFDPTSLLKLLYEENKIPLLRIYDKTQNRNYSEKSSYKDYISKIIDVTMRAGFKGVVLSCENAKNNFNGFGEFLIELRRAMIGCDLILLTEVDETTPGNICELADGNVLFYHKLIKDDSLSFQDGEKSCYANYAAYAESAKTFIDIPTLALSAQKFLPVEDAISAARMQKAEIKKDNESLICNFADKKLGRCSFNSLSSVKSTYQLIDEFGYMGASFDISRTPITYLLMYNACFKTLTNTTTRAVEGCAERRKNTGAF